VGHPIKDWLTPPGRGGPTPPFGEKAGVYGVWFSLNRPDPSNELNATIQTTANQLFPGQKKPRTSQQTKQKTISGGTRRAEQSGDGSGCKMQGKSSVTNNPIPGYSASPAGMAPKGTEISHRSNNRKPEESPTDPGWDCEKM